MIVSGKLDLFLMSVKDSIGSSDFLLALLSQAYCSRNSTVVVISAPIKSLIRVEKG